MDPPLTTAEDDDGGAHVVKVFRYLFMRPVFVESSGRNVMAEAIGQKNTVISEENARKNNDGNTSQDLGICFS